MLFTCHLARATFVPLSSLTKLIVMKGSKNKGRRSFIKSTILGSSAALIGGTAFSASLPDKKTEEASKKLIKRKLGNTGLELPIVSMGVMSADNPNIVKAAYRSGITHFDTAHYYQNGNNEKMVGEALKEFPRDSYYIATKVLPEYDTANGWDNRTISENCTKELFIQRFNTSLERLQMDYVDILYLHAVPNREIALTPHLIEAMQTLKAEGKIRHIGISTHDRMSEVIDAAIESEVYEVVLTAINFRMKDDKALFDSMKHAHKKGIGVVAMKTMAGVYLDKERTQMINCKAALKWAMQYKYIHTSIPGMETYEHLVDNLSVMENLKLTDEEKAELASYELTAGLFCDGCKECYGQCKKGLPINDLMRAYMYTYGYKNTKEAYQVLASCDVPSDPCKDCVSCTVTCKKGFNIGKKVADVTRLKDIPTDFLT